MEDLKDEDAKKVLKDKNTNLKVDSTRCKTSWILITTNNLEVQN